MIGKFIQEYHNAFVGQNYEQMYMLKKGLKVFKERGVHAAKAEVSQMHHWMCFYAMTVKELSHREQEWAQEGLLFLTEKKDGSVKGRLTYNGKKTQEWISKADKSSPTAHTESLLLTAAIDVHQRRNVMTMDIPNAFIQALLPLNLGGEQVIMKVWGLLVDWLVKLDPAQYANKVGYENGCRVLYREILHVMFGMLIASLLWYLKLRKD